MSTPMPMIFLKRWVYRARRTLYPWMVLAIAICRIVSTTGVERDRERVRWMKTLTKIDAVALISFLNELLW